MAGVQSSNSPLMEMQAIPGSDPDADVRVELVSAIQTSPSFASAKVQLFCFIIFLSANPAEFIIIVFFNLHLFYYSFVINA